MNETPAFFSSALNNTSSGQVVGTITPDLRDNSPRLRRDKRAAALVIACCMIGCAQMLTEKRPQLYPNEKLARTSSVQAQADVDQCIRLADAYIKEPNKYADVAKQGLIGGVVGAGTGAVAGTIVGETGRGTGAGAAVGGILGVLKGLSEMNERSPSYERFVEHCLQKQGYEIIGWGA